MDHYPLIYQCNKHSITIWYLCYINDVKILPFLVGSLLSVVLESWKNDIKYLLLILKYFYLYNLQTRVNLQNTKHTYTHIFHLTQFWMISIRSKIKVHIRRGIWKGVFAFLTFPAAPRRLALHSGRHQFYDVFYPISSLALSPWNRIHSKVCDHFEKHVGQAFWTLL